MKDFKVYQTSGMLNFLVSEASDVREKVQTLTGDIVSFVADDQTAMKIVVDIDSETSITECKLFHTGKNMYDPSIIIYQMDAEGKFTTGSGTGYTIIETGQGSSSAVISEENYAKLLGLPAGHYCGYIKCYSSANEIGSIRTVSPIDKKTTTIVSLTSIDSDGNCTFDFTLTEYTKIVFRLSKYDLYYSNLMIAPYSFGTNYEPYQGTTYPISWQTEVGTITNGMLTIDYDGSVTLETGGQTYTLTSISPIETLIGDNNIWSDAGPVSVTYPI